MDEPMRGWYPDPWRVAAYRFWDGAAWTGYVDAGVAAQEAAPVPVPVYEPVPVYAPASTTDPWANTPAANRAPLVWWLAGASVAAVFVVSISLAWLISR